MIFVALLYATLVTPEFCDENRKCKLAAISLRFVAARLEVSNMFETSCNLMAIWEKSEVNMVHQ